jgi:hypothetical protein
MTAPTRLALSLLAALLATAAHAQATTPPPADPGAAPPTETGAVPPPEAGVSPGGEAPRAKPGAPPAAAPAKPTGGSGEPAGAVLVEVTGTVRSVDRAEHRVAIETAEGTVDLSVDRNTLVYVPAGLGTVLDLVPGATVRAGRDSAFVAFWVQVRPAAPAAPSQAARDAPPAGTP